MSKTKIAGWLMIVAAVLNTAVDLLNGNGFSLSQNFDNIIAALTGAGFIKMRESINDLKNTFLK